MRNTPIPLSIEVVISHLMAILEVLPRKVLYVAYLIERKKNCTIVSRNMPKVNTIYDSLVKTESFE